MNLLTTAFLVLGFIVEGCSPNLLQIPWDNSFDLKKTTLVKPVCAIVLSQDSSGRLGLQPTAMFWQAKVLYRGLVNRCLLWVMPYIGIGLSTFCGWDTVWEQRLGFYIPNQQAIEPHILLLLVAPLNYEQ